MRSYNNLVSHNSIGTDRKQIPGLGTKNFISQSTAGSINFMSASVSLAPQVRGHAGAHSHHDAFVIELRNSKLRKPPIL